MKKVATVLLACLIVFSMVSCKEESEMKVLSMADAAKINAVISELNHASKVGMSGECDFIQMPVVSDTDIVAEFTGKIIEKYNSGSDIVMEMYFTKLISGTEILLENVKFSTSTDFIKSKNNYGNKWYSPQVFKDDIEVMSGTAEYTSITDVYNKYVGSIYETITGYMKCANDFCKYYESQSYQLTTDTDCKEVGMLSKDSTLTLIYRNDNGALKEKGKQLSKVICDTEFEIKSKLNGKDFNVSFSTLENIAVINGVKYAASYSQFMTGSQEW